MFLSLDTLTSIIWAGLPILVELIDLVNSSTALLDFFLSSDASICSAMAFRPFSLVSIFGKCRPNADVYRVKVVTYLQI